MDTKQKVATFGLITVGALEAPLLDLYVDKKRVADWLAENGNNCPSEGYYPLYNRMAVVIPGITGMVALGVGLLADFGGKQRIKPEYQLYALEYGSAAVAGAIGKIIQVAQSRVDQGLPAFFPKCPEGQQQQQMQYGQIQQAQQVAPATGSCSCSGTTGMYRPMASA